LLDSRMRTLYVPRNPIQHYRIGIGNPGSRPTAPQTSEGAVEERYHLSQRALAELLGTALLVLVGPGSVVATLTLAGKSVPAVTGADLLGISFGCGYFRTTCQSGYRRCWSRVTWKSQ
jgi:hypothetical protein